MPRRRVLTVLLAALAGSLVFGLPAGAAGAGAVGGQVMKPCPPEPRPEGVVCPSDSWLGDLRISPKSVRAGGTYTVTWDNDTKDSIPDWGSGYPLIYDPKAYNGVGDSVPTTPVRPCKLKPAGQHTWRPGWTTTIYSGDFTCTYRVDPDAPSGVAIVTFSLVNPIGPASEGDWFRVIGKDETLIDGYVRDADVLDDKGAAVSVGPPLTRHTVTLKGKGGARTARTDRFGYFSFRTRQAGPYTLTAGAGLCDVANTKRCEQVVSFRAPPSKHVVFAPGKQFLISGTVVSMDCGETSCTEAGLGGVTVTARSAQGERTATTADDGSFQLHAPSGDYEVAPAKDDLEFDPALKRLSLDADVKDLKFAVCSLLLDDAEPVQPVLETPGHAPKCPPNFEAFGLEVVQKVQKTDWARPGAQTVPGVRGRVPGGTYAGVRLVGGIDLLARLYARVDPATRSSTAPTAVLVGYANGRKLGEATPRIAPGMLRSGVDVAALRPDATTTYDFVVPAAWTRNGALTLVGELRPTGECEKHAGKRCEVDNRYALGGLRFVETGPLTVDVVPIAFKNADGTMGASTVRIAESGIREGTRRVLPVPDAKVHVRGAYTTHLILTQAIRGAQQRTHIAVDGVLATCIQSAPCLRELVHELGLRLADDGRLDGRRAAVFLPFVITTTGSVTTGFTWENVSVFLDSPLDAIHELIHQEDVRHAPGCGATGSDPGWPASDPNGTILGWGVERRSGAWVVLPPSSTYDFMGYCASTTGNDWWISTRNWDVLVGRFMTRARPAR